MFNYKYCIIPAAGLGQRMNEKIPKQYLTINGQTILEHTIKVFLSHSEIKKIVVVIHPKDAIWSSLTLSQHDKIMTVHGGELRVESVLAGLIALKSLAQLQDWVLVHDGARPCLQKTNLDQLMQAVRDHSVGGLLGVPMTDTVKKVVDGRVETTLARDNIWCAQTPQMFRYEKLLNALQHALAHNISVTDEASAIELLGDQPLMIPGHRNNIKLTYPNDLSLIESILNAS